MGSACFRLPEPTADAVVKAFARNDALLKHLAVVSASDGEDAEQVEALAPGDDYHLAPYALLPVRGRRSKYCQDPPTKWWLVFTGYEVHDAHDRALQAMGARERGCKLTSLGDVEEGALGQKVPRSKWAVFRGEAWAGGDDVCLQLEEHAVSTACAALGVDAPADWRALRAAHVELLTEGSPAHGVQLPTLPEWGRISFKSLTPAEQHAFDKAERAREAEEAETRKRERDEAQADADEQRMKRYRHTLDECKDAAVPASAACQFVFSTNAEGEEARTPCPYDRKEDSPFCSMCRIMVAKATAGA